MRMQYQSLAPCWQNNLTPKKQRMLSGSPPPPAFLWHRVFAVTDPGTRNGLLPVGAGSFSYIERLIHLKSIKKLLLDIF
ncbi:Hypothetical protein Minf_0347 [Methylacidiphilum infernorum V4]|uniref:Uncharacterized protein n=1 Tax=Methylacidiphilum infernorum (isolate V4) TaxID=481448 RepID=B3DYC8_METI4|nr:Hypothetical protein Minf_0347 [Methylacidiphilum infernorum V4]